MSDRKDGGRWGYASYDIDRYDDYSDNNLQYTRYEKSDSVNRYGNNGDGGHSHHHWSSSDSYNKGEEPNYSRSESNDSSNPSIGEVQSGSGCFLTTACMKYMKDKFDDHCYELEMLRWFRDNFVSKEDVDHYYKMAPMIVKILDNIEDSYFIYEYIYSTVILPCVEAIERSNYDFAYRRYKECILDLEKEYLRPVYGKRLVNALNKRISTY